MTKPKIMHLIVNPYGGKGKSLALANEVKSQLEAADIQTDIHMTEYYGHSQQIIADIDFDEQSGICGVGGDGTAHHLINGMLNRPDNKTVPIGLIPGGTGNDLAYDLGIKSLNDAIECIVLGHTRSIDIGCVEAQKSKTYIGVVVTWGYATRLTMTAEKMRWFGLSRYTVAGVIELLRHKGYQGKVTLDNGEVIDGQFDLFMVLNSRYTGKRVLTAPDGKLDDGLLDLIMVRNQGRKGLYKTLMDIQNNKIETNTIAEFRQFKKLTLEPASNFDINIDGELYDTAPCTISVLPDKLRLYSCQQN